MKLILFGGFLGSGKTTIIMKLIRALAARGELSAIIENEIGEVGVDQDVLGEAKISVTPLFGGCVCCQLQGDLVAAAKKIHDQVNPDYLIVETTGVAIPQQLGEIYRNYGEKDVPFIAFCVVDAARWSILRRAARPLVESQLRGIDTVIVNKEDVKMLPDEDAKLLEELAGDANIIHMSAPDASDEDVLKLLAPSLGIEVA